VATPDSEPAGAQQSTHKKKGAHTHRLALPTVIAAGRLAVAAVPRGQLVAR